MMKSPININNNFNNSNIIDVSIKTIDAILPENLQISYIYKAIFTITDYVKGGPY